MNLRPDKLNSEEEHGGSVVEIRLKIEGLPVRASPEALHYVLEQDTLSSA